MEQHKHGGTGNQNAMIGEEPRSSYIQIRVASKDKARYVRQASSQGLKLSQWVLQILDRACNNSER